MANVEVRNLSLSFGAQKALDDVSISFDDGGFYGLLGPSGSGKTTLLRSIAGFQFPDSGTIRIGGEAMEKVPVDRRRIGMMFQNYALFPNMSVADNVAFGLRVRGGKAADIAREVSGALDLVQLGPLGKRRPHELSGGQRQRVALARAIVTKPRVLLLDEPLSALDKALRTDMQVELKRIQREVGITTIFVTHDQDEALSISDRVGILRDGRIVQEGTPEEIYDRPATEFAATFLGEANILSGRIEDGQLWLEQGARVPLPPDTRPAGPARSGPLRCAIRPERIRIAPAATGSGRLSGNVGKRLFSGSLSTYFVDCAGHEIKVVTQRVDAGGFDIGDAVSLDWAPEALVPLPAESNGSR